MISQDLSIGLHTLTYYQMLVKYTKKKRKKKINKRNTDTGGCCRYDTRQLDNVIGEREKNPKKQNKTKKDRINTDSAQY